MSYLKQNTAATIRVGPFVNISDGSINTTLAVTATTACIYKHSSTIPTTATSFSPTVSGGSHDMALVTSGIQFELEIPAADVDVLGLWDIDIRAANVYPIFDRYMVVAAASYDSNVSGDVATPADMYSIQTSDGAFSTAGGIGERLLTLLTDTAIDEATGPLDATPTPTEILGYLKALIHNKVAVTNSLKTIYNDAGTAIATQALTDDGTTATQDKAATP